MGKRWKQNYGIDSEAQELRVRHYIHMQIMCCVLLVQGLPQFGDCERELLLLTALTFIPPEA